MSTTLVTGANRGIGLELARGYLSRGWNVLAVARHLSRDLERLAKENELKLHLGDLRDDDFIRRLGHQLRSVTIDVLINNAGTMGNTTLHEAGHDAQGLADFDRGEWREVFEVNLFAPAQLTAVLSPRIPDGGKLVTVSSDMGSVSANRQAGWMAYRASKAGVNALMRSAGLELADRGIVSAAVHPGWVRTDMGGPEGRADPAETAAALIELIDRLGPKDSGKYLDWRGEEMPY